MRRMEMIKMMNDTLYDISNRRYLGSKTRLLDFIDEIVSEKCGDINTVLDLFGGTGTVANHFNKPTISVYVNDILSSNYKIYKSWFISEEIDIKKLNNLICEFNEVNDVGSNYFSRNYGDTYFSESNARRIGWIRNRIEKLSKMEEINDREEAILISSLIYSADRIANTVGHYDAYRKTGNLDKELTLRLFDLPDDEVNFGNKVFNKDANTLVKEINADLVYIDPPYNSRQYGDAYHLLENISDWKKPKVHGVARKMDRKHLKSQYCMQKAPEAFEDLIKNINAKYILVSYNNMGSNGASRSQAKISDDDIIRILREKGSLEIFEKDFNYFTTGKSDINNHKERLFLVKVGEKDRSTHHQLDMSNLVKSPLNYTGGKYKILSQILPLFPNDFNTFIDLFGGGFNVGANVDADLVVYNDISLEVSRVIKLFHTIGTTELTNKVKELINNYKLSSTYDKGYPFYESHSSTGVGKYNKEKFLRLRKDYNALSRNSVKKDIILLTLIIHAFNNQIRFNSSGSYNMPVGKRDFNSSTRKNFLKFSTRLLNKSIEFKNLSFEKLDYTKYNNPFIYCDPPYILGTASYNESDGWTPSDESKLLDYLKIASDNGVRFALSNVVKHKGENHKQLLDWVFENRFNIHYIDVNYNNSSYQKLNKEQETIEVLITNY